VVNKLEFIRAMRPEAVEAIGAQHGWLVRWALAKAARETGWDMNNALVRQARNCLGIKAEDAWGRSFAGVKWIIMAATTGPEAGKEVHWRVFATLGDCFREFVRQINDRDPWYIWRTITLAGFEQIYADKLGGHAEGVLRCLHDVTEEMQLAGLTDEKGRLRETHPLGELKQTMT